MDRSERNELIADRREMLEAYRLAIAEQDRLAWSRVVWSGVAFVVGLAGGLALGDVRTVDVDLIEVSRVLDDEGGFRFQQVVAWDNRGEYAINRGYKVVGAYGPAVEWYGDHWRAVCWRGGSS